MQSEKAAIVGTKRRIDGILKTAMHHGPSPGPGIPPPEGYYSLQDAALMWLKAFPNRSFRPAPREQPCDAVSSAGRLLAKELPVYGWNVGSHVFERILTSNMYVFSEDLTRAEHAVWPTVADGNYTYPAVKIEEFKAYLHREIRLDVTRSRRLA